MQPRNSWLLVSFPGMRYVGGAGLCPAGAQNATGNRLGAKEGAHGGTQGSPVLDRLYRSLLEAAT
jgi:hypothetical protein